MTKHKRRILRREIEMAPAADLAQCRTLAEYDEFTPARPIGDMEDAEVEAAIAEEVWHHPQPKCNTRTSHRWTCATP